MRGEGESAPITPAFFITPSICLSSSSRSVTTRMRASGSCSSSHLAISTIRMLLPLPWVCQMTPPSRLAMRSCAALTPTNWCGRGTFFCPRVEDDEVADQVEQARLVAQLRQRPVEQRAGRRRVPLRADSRPSIRRRTSPACRSCRSAAPVNRCLPARAARC